MAKNIIKLNRGDSYKFEVNISPDDYPLLDTEAVYFALLNPHQHFKDANLVIGYNHTDIITEKDDTTDEILFKIEINIEPRHTRNLAPGIYYYTVKLFKLGSSEHRADVLLNYDKILKSKTLVERTKFIINE